MWQPEVSIVATKGLYCGGPDVFVYILFYVEKNKIIILPIVIILYLFSHVLSLVGVFILSFSLFQYGIFTKNVKEYFIKTIVLMISFFCFFTIYKLLYNFNFVLPLFDEQGGNIKNLEFSMNALNYLTNHTWFSKYFFGIYTPLTLIGITFCLISKEFKIRTMIDQREKHNYVKIKR